MDDNSPMEIQTTNVSYQLTKFLLDHGKECVKLYPNDPDDAVFRLWEITPDNEEWDALYTYQEDIVNEVISFLTSPDAANYFNQPTCRDIYGAE
jgi:hypothetical protein